MQRRFPAVYKLLNVVHERLFTWSRGRIFGTMLGMVVVKMTIPGRKTGIERTTMITSPLTTDDEIVLVASYRGGPKHPAWYHNLMAHPTVPVQRRGFSGPMTAHLITGDDRARLWERLTALHGRYEKYQSRAERELPVIVFTPPERRRPHLLGPASDETSLLSDS